MRAQISMRINTGTKPAGLLRLLAMLVLVMAVLSPLAAQAQGNYVYVNNQAAANTVSGYSVSAAGALTQLSGSPFSTGGAGANVVCSSEQNHTVPPGMVGFPWSMPSDFRPTSTTPQPGIPEVGAVVEMTVPSTVSA